MKNKQLVGTKAKVLIILRRWSRADGGVLIFIPLLSLGTRLSGLFGLVVVCVCV